MTLQQIPMEDYVADNVGAPSPTLNSGLANRLLTRSPLHAWWGHPKLNPEWQSSTSEAFDIGTAAHDAVIEGLTRFEAVDAPDWRTKTAKEERDRVRAEGKIPLLLEQAKAVTAMTGPALRALRDTPDLAGLGPLDTEQTAVWQDEISGAWLRCRPDWITRDRTILLSYKTTSANAEPDAFARTILNMGYDMQMAFEMNAIEAVCGVKPTHYIWVVQETGAPYAVSLVGMSNQMREYGQARFDAATLRWSDCMRIGAWPGYPGRVCYVDPPSWAMAQIEELNGS